jgi:hypothetical protein
MAITDYNPPVDQLLHKSPHDLLGDWSGYLKLGISAAQIPDLIQMLGDQSLYEDALDEAEDRFYWAAPVHAWRMLAQLKAEAAIEPLLAVVRQYMDEDTDWWEWIIEEFPQAFAEIGPVTLPALASHLADSTQSSQSLGVAVNSVAHIGMAYPDERQQCIDILMHKLESYAEQDIDLNAFLVTALVIDLKAVEAAPLIEQAFEADKVDEMFMGDWGEVQVELGLKTRAEVPVKKYYISPPEPSRPSHFSLAGDSIPKGIKARQVTQKKAKRKQQQESRRRNRKKK